MKRVLIVLLTLCFVTLGFADTKVIETGPRVRIIDDYGRTMKLEGNSSLPVTLQDQTTPVVIVPLHKKLGESTLSAEGTIDTYTITVVDATGFVAGNLIILTDVVNSQVYIGTQIGAPAGNVISLDRPLDYTYVIGTLATRSTTNMNVNGTLGTETFGLKQGFDTGLQITADITRIMITMITASSCDLSTFGDIGGGITNGVTVRRRDGNRVNLFNIKSNQEIAGIAYDMTIYAATNPTQGQDGVNARLTFAGQSKMGVVVRVGPGEDIEAIIRDNLTTLTRFVIVAEGSIALVD
jgi:hypothetical protein